MVLPQYKNNATTALDGVHNSGSSTLTVIDASVFPTLGVGDTFFVTLWNKILYSRTGDDPDMEVVEVNDVTDNTLTLVSPTTNDHVSGVGVDNMLTEDFFNALETDLAADAAALVTHETDDTNPHSVTKTQVGLGNVTDDAQLRSDQLETITVTDDDDKVPSLGLMYSEKVAMQAEIDSDIATHTAIADAHHTNANDPTANEKLAMEGSYGSPSGSNRYVTETDPRYTEDYIPTSEKGAVSGVAELDTNGKVPLSQINDSIIGQVEYMGLWDADTNDPTLPSTPTEKGHYYIVSVAGTFESINFEIGDWIISDGTAWGKVDNTDAVSSVFGRTGNVTAQAGDYTASDVGLGNVSNDLQLKASQLEITTVSDDDTLVPSLGLLYDVQQAINSLIAAYLPLAGGVMSGSIDMASNEVFLDESNYPYNKLMMTLGETQLYGTDSIRFRLGGTTKLLIEASGITTTVPLYMSLTKISSMADPTLAQDAATKNYVDSNFMADTGTRTISGITTHSSSTSDTILHSIEHLGTMNYGLSAFAVISAVAQTNAETCLAKFAMTNASSTRPVVRVENYGTGDCIYIKDASGEIFSIDSSGNLNVTGDIAMNSNNITGLADPSLDQDAATKSYVDAHAFSLGNCVLGCCEDGPIIYDYATQIVLASMGPTETRLAYRYTIIDNDFSSIDGLTVDFLNWAPDYTGADFYVDVRFYDYSADSETVVRHTLRTSGNNVVTKYITNVPYACETGDEIRVYIVCTTTVTQNIYFSNFNIRGAIYVNMDTIGNFATS